MPQITSKGNSFSRVTYRIKHNPGLYGNTNSFVHVAVAKIYPHSDLSVLLGPNTSFNITVKKLSSAKMTLTVSAAVVAYPFFNKQIQEDTLLSGVGYSKTNRDEVAVQG